VSAKVGIIVEGSIDEILVPPLLERIARDRAGFTWPTIPDDLADIIPIRKRGHGGVLDAVRRLVRCLSDIPLTEYAFFIILLDSPPAAVHRRLRRLTQGKPRFVLGIAIREIEAWWLADRRNTLAWLRLDEEPRGKARYWAASYKPENDHHPKRTLDELTVLAPELDQHYGHGNTELAREFAEDYWRGSAELDAMERSCPRGFRPFCRDTTEALRAERAREGRLL